MWVAERVGERGEKGDTERASAYGRVGEVQYDVSQHTCIWSVLVVVQRADTHSRKTQ